MDTKLPPVPRTQGLQASSISDSKNGTLVPFGSKSAPVGPSYSLQNSNIKFKLPQPKSLKPYVDITSGSLDTWPAYASGTGHLGPQSIDPRSVPKPKFLEQLEAFLQKELRALDGGDHGSVSERRLQAFREVFECLIEDFKTYRPILSAIKHEYELMIVSQRERIRELEPYKASLVTVYEQCEQRLIAVKQDERGEVADLKKEKEMLRQSILKLKEENSSLNEQVKRLQNEIAEEYKRYRDESDARKLLIHDLNDLRYQTTVGRKTSILVNNEGDEDSDKEDPVLLRIALRKAREDLETKTMQLAEVMANYGDVIPRRDYEKLEKDFANMKEEMEVLQADYDSLHKDHTSILDIHKKTMEERDKYCTECEQFRRSGTPRPNWDKCGQYIEGGEERWQSISQGLSSDHLVDVLLSEMTGQDVALIQAGTGSQAEYFEGLGIGEEIPLPLRWEGKVHNRRLSRRDALLLIKDIWSDRISALRALSAEKTGKKESFHDFLAHYLRGRFGSDDLAAEWAYNLQDACQRYHNDIKIGMFYSILNAHLAEDVFHDNMRLLDNLARGFKSADKGNKGYLVKEEFKSALAAAFPQKSKDALEALVSAAEDEINPPSDHFPYVKLLAESEDGQPGAFVSLFIEQRLVEQVHFVRQLEEKLKGKSILTPDEAKEMIRAVGTDLPETKYTEIVGKGFRTSSDSINSSQEVETSKFIENLKVASLPL